MFEQYKLAVEMWDRVRARRQHANSFYVTINSAIVAALIVKGAPEYVIAPAAIAGVAVCALWLITIMNYKTLTDGKFHVICQLEQQLPSAPFRSEPGGPNLLPFTKVERSIPIVFAVLYAWVALFRVAGS
jgi:hypothetical protein